MKTMPKSLLLIAAAFGLAVAAFAHADKKTAGPNGGRILTSVTPHVEFFITPDRHLQFTFLDEQGRPVAPAGQTVTVTTGNRSAPAVLAFSRRDNVLLSDTTLPAGNNLPAVIQLKPAPDAAVVVERFNINLALCNECEHAEYACTCEH